MNHKIVASQNISRNCLVCGIDNDFGLKTRFYQTDKGELIAVFKPLSEHQSYPNVTHGGISAAILDEVIGRAIMTTTDSGTFGVTLELKMRYKKPVPTGVELKALGRITRDGGRIFEGSGELFLPDGTVAAEAEGKYMKRNIDQITDQDFTANEWFVPEEDLPDEIHI
ncbi:MAG: thioesterase [Desulfuromonas sp.]|nr:MAG: thioesterase [Desulfuromonas sp.]